MRVENKKNVASDIARLKEYVEGFNTDFIEVRFHQRLDEIARRWPLYRQSLADLVEARRKQS
ncbi:MAG: hypothetical protein LAT77_00785 [Aliidiomarina sp.]|uniref:hypothetical protein n=1 Tax=Aliidiomarina sp. TaxID=1872439 RepID=UPI0025C4A673|nr:hypothetical protein [Aliidiomarina sp.]MCH8500427.1 hypothetical protein [Aliidiomarina sp.]